jgi:hypothetical protein
MVNPNPDKHLYKYPELWIAVGCFFIVGILVIVIIPPKYNVVTSQVQSYTLSLGDGTTNFKAEVIL